METLMKADIFFFVTTIAVVLVLIAFVIFFIQLSRLMSTCNRIAKNVEIKAAELGEEAEEMIEDIRESFLFRLMFPKAKKRTKRK